MQKVKQCMLLAAGLSTRMRPLTNDIPKPLVPFLGKRILDFTLDYLHKNGITEICTNVFHGKEKYLAALKPLHIRPFEEKPVILGTGGGIQNMKSFITDEHFMVTNCDFFTDVDIQKVFEFHIQKKSIATMVLIDSPLAKRYGAIGVNPEGKIVDFPHGNPPGGATQSGFFSGIHIFHRDIFNKMPQEQNFCINENVYSKIVEQKGPAFGYVAKTRWIDVGEVELYKKAQEELKKDPLPWM